MKHRFLPLSIIILAASSSLSVTSEAAPLNVEDYCDVKLSAPQSIKEMRPLADGHSYAAISDDEKSIDIYSYKTGKRTGTLFNIDNIKGDLKIEEFEGYTLSANEKKILLWNNSKQIYRRSFTADFFVYDVMRGTLTKVSEERTGLRCATLSHDGRMVAYMHENNLYISNLDYKTDRAITDDGKMNEIIYGAPDWGYEEEFGIDNTIRWSGDDTTLAFIRFDESKVPTYSFDNYRGFCQPDPLGDPYPDSYSYKYPLAGYPNSVVSVLAYDMDNRTTKKMEIPMKESDYIPSMEFDGAGSTLMVMVLNHDQNNLNLYKVNPKSTIAKSILSEKGNAWLDPSAYQMVEYGDNTFVIGSDRSGYRHLYEYDYFGNMKRQISKGNYNVTAYYGFDKRTGNHYLQTTSRGAINRNVAKIDKKGILTLLNDRDGFESAAFSTTFDYYLRTYSNAQTPTQYTVCNSVGKLVAEVEMNREYASRYANAPKMEFLKVPNGEGKEMNAYIIKPTGFDSSKKYPLLMYQYNGPDSQEVLNRWRMEGIFYLASQGYVVAAVDGRGTGNRSREWAHSVYRQLGRFETIDQIAGANHFISMPFIDSERTACFGWSYGGYMTLMELSDPSCPFKAGVSMAPVTDWRYYDSIYTERYMLTPQQNERGYDIASAINRTSDMDKILLIMSGTSDDNVHFYNTLKYTSKLTSEGTLFDMMAYTAFEHSLRMCNARTMLFKKIAHFLDQNL